MARSAQPRRGCGWVRRRMATSWRSTRSSMSLVADVWPISKTSPRTCRKSNTATAATPRDLCLASDHAGHRPSPTLASHRAGVVRAWSALALPGRAQLATEQLLAASLRLGTSLCNGCTRLGQEPVTGWCGLLRLGGGWVESCAACGARDRTADRRPGFGGRRPRFGSGLMGSGQAR